ELLGLEPVELRVEVALLGRAIGDLDRMGHRQHRPLLTHDFHPPYAAELGLDQPVGTRKMGDGMADGMADRIVDGTAAGQYADVVEGIRATIAAYTQALDDGRTDDVVATYCDDGVF